VIARPRIRCLLALILGSTLFFAASQSQALTEAQIRMLVNRAVDFEKQSNWEKAREIYEALLGQNDPGLRIRDRYHQVLRRCWQVRRHQDISYRKEVLSIEYAQALQLYTVISNTLLDGSTEKKKLDSTKLFRKGLEELDAALADPVFLEQHVPTERLAHVDAFRAQVRKAFGKLDSLSRKEAATQIGNVAMEAERSLQLNPTVVAMEFACGACYAIDEYTAYLTPNQLRELAQSFSRSEAIGVGLTLDIRDNRIVIHSIAVDSSARMVNPPVKEHDQIVRVNNKKVDDLPLHIVKELLEGPVGSMVDVQIKSADDGMMRTVSLQRRTMITSVSYFMQPGKDIGYIGIGSFTYTTSQEVDEAIARLLQMGMKGLILDVRDNTGGIFESAIETARKFLNSGIITSTQHQDSKLNCVYHAKNPSALPVPMVVLINGETASAAEVLAGALKDNNRAYLIGQTTFGKGCTQCVLKLPNATGGVPTGGMKLTVARFFSPKGVSYSSRGINPDLFIDEVAQAEFARDGVDLYRLRAEEHLNRVLMMQK
jgi:carboxyl-terminal processing protease